MKKIVIIALLISFFAGSCYYDTEEDLYPQAGACDVSGVTYSSTVLPLLQANGCIGCHSGGAPSGNILLSGYNAVKAVAQTGKLYGAIDHQPGFSPMPQGGNKLRPCDINRIRAWIDAGAPNN